MTWFPVLVLIVLLLSVLMAAPAATARGTPTGLMLTDGHPTKVTLALAPTISFQEKATKPPGYDGGESIDTTTFFNTSLRTMAPRALKTLTPMTFTAAYDPGVITDINSAINRRDTITVTHPDGTTWAFFGYLQKFEPTENKEGAQPEAQVTIVPTNTDSSGAEQALVLVNVAGT